MDRKQHWDTVYKTKRCTEVSWYEPDPKQSMALILEAVGSSRGRVIDVGGGQSFLVDRLLDAGFAQVAVLDISIAAIEATQSRLGDRSSKVNWIAADITEVNFLGEFDIWHDRAVLHFLIEPDDQQHYVHLLRSTLPSGGYFIVAAFAKGGPIKCSGLPVQQYDETSMGELLGSDFKQVLCMNRKHKTPSGTDQEFFYGVYQRT